MRDTHTITTVEQATSQEARASLFECGLTLDEHKGHRGVHVTLFRDGYFDEFYRTHVPAGVDSEDGYVRSLVDHMFEERVVEDLRRTFEGVNGVRFKARPASMENWNGIGCGAVPVGGPTGCLMFETLPDWPLPFAVRGFYDLRTAETGPWTEEYEDWKLPPQEVQSLEL